MPYDLSACGLVTVCQLRAGGTGNTIAIGNDGGGVYIETEGTIGSRNIRIQNGNSGFSLYSSLNVSGNDQAVWFNTNSTTRMYINSSGNVGIGTTSPISKLHVEAGQIRMHGLPSDGITGCSGYYLANAPNNEAFQWQMSCNFNLSLWTYSATNGLEWGLRGPVITQTGNVGIGTTNPEFSLVICRASTPLVQLKNPNDTSFGVILEHTGLNSELWNYENGYVRFGTANVERLRITNAGNVGIGTTSPAINLHVQGTCNNTVSNTTFWNFNFSGAEVTNLSNCPSSVAGLALIGGSGRGSVSAIANLLETTGLGQLAFFTGGGATGTVPERMRITSGGCVGIGTSSPGSLLTVTNCNAVVYCAQNTLVNGQWLRLSNPNGTAGVGTGILFEAAGAVGGNGLGTISGVSTAVGSLSITFGTRDAGSNVTERMRLTSGGCLGINTTSPSYALHVNGTFYAAGSSIKYKEGICNYNIDSCLFMCLKPVTYQYKDEWKHLGKELKSDTQIGLIAEDVADVMPELAVLVNEEDEKVVRNVDYEKLSIVLLAEVQKLRREVDTLKNN